MGDEVPGPLVGILRDMGSYYLLGGDMILQKDEPLHQASIQLYFGQGGTGRALDSLDNRWPGGIVEYTVDSAFNASEKYEIRSAMNQWEEAGGVQFREVADSGQNYVYHIIKTPGLSYSGNSTVGYCANAVSHIRDLGAMLHELGHGLGLEHEHHRPDRNSYVTVKQEYQGLDNFMILSGISGWEFAAFGPYDFQSIMHYDRYFFESEPNGNLIRLDSNLNFLSNGDKVWAATIYGPAVITSHPNQPALSEMFYTAQKRVVNIDGDAFENLVLTKQGHVYTLRGGDLYSWQKQGTFGAPATNNIAYKNLVFGNMIGSDSYTDIIIQGPDFRPQIYGGYLYNYPLTFGDSLPSSNNYWYSAPWRTFQDLNGDGHPDFIGIWGNNVAVNQAIPYLNHFYYDSNVWHREGGSGIFKPFNYTYMTHYPFRADWKALADVNGDGYSDFVGINSKSPTFSYVVLGNSSGYFDHSASGLQIMAHQAYFGGDLKSVQRVGGNDPYADFISIGSNNAYVVPGTASGVFDYDRRQFAAHPAFGYTRRFLDDMNGDGNLDFVSVGNYFATIIPSTLVPGTPDTYEFNTSLAWTGPGSIPSSVLGDASAWVGTGNVSGSSTDGCADLIIVQVDRITVYEGVKVGGQAQLNPRRLFGWRIELHTSILPGLRKTQIRELSHAAPARSGSGSRMAPRWPILFIRTNTCLGSKLGGRMRFISWRFGKNLKLFIVELHSFKA